MALPPLRAPKNVRPGHAPVDMKVLKPKNPIDVRTPPPWGPKPPLNTRQAGAPLTVPGLRPRESNLAHFPDRGVREAYFAAAEVLRGPHPEPFLKLSEALSELVPQLRFSTLGEPTLIEGPFVKVTTALFNLEDVLISAANKPSLTPAERARFVLSADRITGLHEHLMIATDTKLPVQGIAGQRLRALTEGPAEIMAKQMRLIQEARSFFDDVSSGLWPSLSKKVNGAVSAFAREVPAAGLARFEKALLKVEDELLAKLKGSTPGEAMRFQMAVAANGLNDMYEAAAVLSGKSQRSPGAPSNRLFFELQRLARTAKRGDEQ